MSRARQYACAAEAERTCPIYQQSRATKAGKAPDQWKRLPKKLADTAQDLKKFGLVETDCSWTWSRADPGAGYYKWTWRKTPNALAMWFSALPAGRPRKRK